LSQAEDLLTLGGAPIHRDQKEVFCLELAPIGGQLFAHGISQRD
jgi:hypothetical protein